MQSGSPSNGAGRKRCIDEREIEVAPRERSEQVSQVGVLVQHDGGGEQPQHRRDESRLQIRGRSDPKCARTRACELREIGLRRSDARDHGLGVREHDLACRRQRERARAAGALDQPPAGQAFQRRDLVADRGLDVAEPCGGASKRSLVRDSLERDEMAKLDARPPLARHARCDAAHASSLGP